MQEESDIITYLIYVSGEEWLLDGESLFGQSLSKTLDKLLTASPIARASVLLAKKRVLSIEDGHILVERNNVEATRQMLKRLGMYVPREMRTSDADMLTWLAENGQSYRQIYELSLRETLPLDETTSFIAPFLATSIAATTDYDLFLKYPSHVAAMASFESRRERVDYLISMFRPAGSFWVSFGFSNVSLTHELKGRRHVHRNPRGIIKALRNTSVSDHPMALYYAAFLFDPKIAPWIYNTDVGEGNLKRLRKIHREILKMLGNNHPPFDQTSEIVKTFVRNLN